MSEEKIITQVTPFTFITAVAIGEILGNALYDRHVGVIDIVFAMSFWGLFVTLIRDGKVLWDEVKDLGFDETWLEKQLKPHNVMDYSRVFIAEWLEGDGIFVQIR